MDIAKKKGVADEYIELERGAGEAQWKALKEANPYGFDVVVSTPAFPPAFLIYLI